MKKIILVLFTICAFQASYSQTEKGKMFIGGQINFSGYSDSELDTLNKYDYNSVRFTITPDFGYFISDNFAIGANIKLGTSNSTYSDENTNPTSSLPSKFNFESTSLSYGLGGFARYYINITDNFKFYFNGGVNYLYSARKETDSNNDPDYVYTNSDPASQEFHTNSISLVVNPGLVYFITPKIGIQTSFGNINYTYSNSKNKSLSYDNHYKSTDYGLNLNLPTFYFGMNYYF